MLEICWLNKMQQQQVRDLWIKKKKLQLKCSYLNEIEMEEIYVCCVESMNLWIMMFNTPIYDILKKKFGMRF